MIYFDNSATTFVDSKVLETFNKVCTEYPGNANSIHSLGVKSKELEDYATDKIAKLLKVKPSEVIFTSSASEANNMALKGICYKYKNRSKHIITTELEHSSTSEAVKFLKDDGFTVHYVKLNDNGAIDLEDLERLLDTYKPIIVSICLVNSEVGILQDIDTIKSVVKKYPLTIVKMPHFKLLLW